VEARCDINRSTSQGTLCIGVDNKMRPAIYLGKKFRNRLFSLAYLNSGKSLGAMALALGYSGKGRNGYVRNMWLGTVAISSPKIAKIAELAGISLSEVLSHRIDKQHNVEIEDWEVSFRLFVQRSKKQA